MTHMQHSPTLSVCVFCGARPGVSPAMTRAAEEVGRLIGERGHRLVYGGGGSGLMGSVAWSAFHAGAPIVGVIPAFLAERERSIAAPPQSVELTHTMNDRKQSMLGHADVFLALAGGYGTLDEVLDVLSLRYLGMLRKPVVLLDVEGCWDQLENMVADVHLRGYAENSLEPLYAVRTTPTSALSTLEQHWSATFATPAATRTAPVGSLHPAGRHLAVEPL
ncbi:TIGR00730 family Rossman fold protein [Micromonospora sp. ANENR4]|uniref:LOG family protein n=1 Tax=unclassified Micromonospora TaxID=2617518 RepID=UPI00188F30AD|nr:MULTISPECIES: TIGR00730 family Rossman fold protein [unclassified Micromonospora]MBF5033675.1 TIGR00730 family Rossman fold protein [Micromonospora sp. ANENR4]MCZ7476249.1 TIGR00730 family Rossman fold protein [Micromonospora sp. WMMC273]